MRESQLAKKLAPYLYNLLGIDKLRGGLSSSGSTGTGVLEPHALSGAYHTGPLSNSQGPQFPLLDGSRNFTGNINVGNNSIVNVNLVDGIDLPAHVGDPEAHHALVTSSDYALDVAGQDITFNAADGLIVDPFGVNVDLATDSGLALPGGQLAMGTPGTLGVGSTNSLSGDYHSHAVDDSNNPGAAAKILASTSAGGLTLESFQSNGEIVALQSGYFAASSLRILHHTHDYNHVHMVVNPGPSWNLDEQFGVDIDDNLLVRGWIVGKHAIQLEGSTFIAHFDGPDPVEINAKGEATGHKGQAAYQTQDEYFRHGKFGKAAEMAKATTNLATNPSFETGDLTGWSTHESTASISSLSVVNSTSHNGEYCLRVSKNSGTTSDYSGATQGRSVTNGITYSFGLWVKCEDIAGGTGTVRVTIGSAMGGGSYEIADMADKEGEWHYLSISGDAISTSASAVYVLLTDCTTGVLYVDSVQIENTGNASPFTPTTRTGNKLYYLNPDEFVEPDKGSIMLWARLPWGPEAADKATGYFFATFGGTLFFRNIGAQLALRMGTGNVLTYTGPEWQDTEWHHYCVTWSQATDTTNLYIDGTLVETDTSDVFDPGDRFYIGSYSDEDAQVDGWIDDFVVANKVVDADEVKAIYESNAPVFAETSTWHWRTGRNRFWADAEGIWMLNASGTKILGAYAGDENNPAATKSWGGVSLEESDLLIGDASRGAYMKWDDSAGTMVYQGQIVMQSGSSGINNFSDAGALATLDDITLSYLTDAGTLAGLDNINLSYVTDSGALAGLSSINLSYVTDAGNLASADDMDDIANGSVYAKIKGSALNGSGLVVLDATIDGTYAKVNAAIVSAGYIQVSSGGSVKDVNLDGWNIGSTEIVGQLDGVNQVVLNTNGVIRAGGHQVEIGGNGIVIDSTDFDDAKLTFRSGLSGDVRGSISFLEIPPTLPNSGMYFYNAQDTGFHFNGGNLYAYDDLYAQSDLYLDGDIVGEISQSDDFGDGNYPHFISNSRAGGNARGLGISLAGTTSTDRSLMIYHDGNLEYEFRSDVAIFDPNLHMEGDLYMNNSIIKISSTAEPSTVATRVQIYVDPADNHLKAKMKNGTVRTLAID